MYQDPLQVLQGSLRAGPTAGKPRLLIAGATGVLGNEALRRLVGGGAYATTRVLAREPITAGLRGVEVAVVRPDDEPAAWPLLPADVGVVLFDPPRLFYDRERALWAPLPEQLPALARWMRACGVRTLAVVMPHDAGRLPDALKRGLAGLDEHAVAAAGFERLLILRSARKPAALAPAGALARLGQWMLSSVKYMVPGSEQPVRAVKVAELLAIALRTAPPGIHVAAPEVVWEAAQGRAGEVAGRWLGTP